MGVVPMKNDCLIRVISFNLKRDFGIPLKRSHKWGARREIAAQVIRDSGTEIITLDDEIREEMVEASQPVYEEIQEVVDPEIYGLYAE